MSFSNRYLRPYQPSSNELNTGFVRAYVADSERGGAESDGRIADPDSTFSGLVQSTLSDAFPPVLSTDATIRVGLPDHAALVGLLIWSLLAFTVPYVLCLGGYALTPDGTVVAGAWCCGVYLVQALLGALAKKDTTLFFHHLNQSWHAVAWLLLGWVLWSARVSGFIPAIILGIIFDRVIFFTSQADPCGSLKAALRVAVIIGLVCCFAAQAVSLETATEGIWSWYLAGNCLFTLPIVWGMQHWFAANRYASRDGVCRYGQGAVLRRISVGRIFSAVSTYLAAALAAAGCTGLVQAAVSEPGLPGFDWRNIGWTLGGISAVGVLHWGVIELLVHHRLPSPRRFFSSLYATWRALAAWLSYESQFDHPAVFQFKQPFTSMSIRGGVVLGAFWINTAICASLLRIWSSAFIAGGLAKRTPESPPAADAWRILDVVSELEFWGPLLLAGILVPPAVFLASLHAVWGPTFLAFSEHFERFDDGTIPPLLSIPAGPRRRSRTNRGVQS